MAEFRCLLILAAAAVAAGCAGGGNQESPLERSARAYFGPDYKGRIAVVLEGPVENVECRRMRLSRAERAGLDDRKAVLFGCRVTFRSGLAHAWTFQRDRWGLIGRQCPKPIGHPHPATFEPLNACRVAPA